MKDEQKEYDEVKQKIHKMLEKYGDETVFPAFATILIEMKGRKFAVEFIGHQGEFLDKVK